MPYFDRLDIVEAWYLALAHCHSGQGSREYVRLSKLSRSFKPSPMLDVETLSENAREIYDNACARMLNTRKD
jgi:hypothetical protein